MTTMQEPIPSIIGAELRRVDGPLKVSGAAMYTSDHNFPGMVYAVPVCSTIAKGRIERLDVSDAEHMPGVVAILHRENIGPLFRPAPDQGFTSYVDEARPPFEDDNIYYWGQYVAVAIAETFEQAQAAAEALHVTYTAEQPDVRTHLETNEEPKIESQRGNTDAAFASAPVKVDQTYSTPVETHNVIELHATVAVWDGAKFTLYETSQAVVNHRAVMAQILGVPREDVRVISKFLGSGFGGKLWPWPHCALAAAAARKLNRPVKLVLSRKMTYSSAGHRPRTEQRVRLGATREGKLVSLAHDYLNHTSIQDDYAENCGEATGHLYSVPNLRISSGLVRRNVGTPTSMRGPGAVPGLFAIESAMDELAVALNIDPVQLRLQNEPEKDESTGLPFSSRHFQECLTLGAQKFGWPERTPAVGSMHSDGSVLGWGVGACSWMAERFGCQASVELKNDGTARVNCGTQDIGTGTYTILAQIVNAKTGIPLDRIEVVLGDTALPAGPISGGSMATASVIPAVSQAATQAVAAALAAAAKAHGSPFAGQKPDSLALTKGRIHAKGKTPETGVPYHEILKRTNMSGAVGVGKSEATFGGSGEKKFSTHSYGVHFVEISWQPEIARLRVNRVVTVIDGGRIINKRAGRNQIEGAIVMGAGMALFEHTRYDPRNGAPVNSNLADYIVATHADTPRIDLTFLDYPDTVLNEFGARGIGEIGLAGVAAAITSAVYHATGVRVRELPVDIEDLLKPV
jgi:xanthine dehydrogenase YagR molybdenum-binding subunit